VLEAIIAKISSIKSVSLHKALNTSEQVHPINSHWTTSHVNYLVDLASENAYG